MTENRWRAPNRAAGWAIFAVLILLLASFAFVSFRPYPTPPGFYRYGFLPFGWPSAFFWIFVIFLALRWVFWPWRWGYYYRRPYGGYRDDPYEILRERYAKGEITKEQFERMMRDLQEHGGR